MRHKGRNQAIVIAALAAVAFIATTHFAHAQSWFSISNLFGLSPLQLFNQFLAMFVNAMLEIMGWLLAVSGFLLNLSIKLTLNIRAFVDSAPAIYTTWRAIRDISGLFLIFFLIYASIQLILGLKSPKWGDTIKNIVLVGVLINFSFFLAGLGIDISNVVSVQIYSAIAPVNSISASSNMLASQASLKSSLDGGISDIFMSALQLPRLYNISNTQTASALGSSGSTAGLFSDTMKIMLIGVLGIIIEFVAAVSFAAAAFAFVGRFVFLLFLLAFSPIMFMDMLAPEIAEYTNQWKKTYKSMLLFMPIYLLLMYMAMNVLTTTPLFQNPNAAVSATATTNTPPVSMVETALAQTPPAGGAAQPWYMDYVMLGVNAMIILFFINMPLAAAASIASKGSKFLEKSMNSIKGVAHGFVGTHTVGAAAGRLDAKLAETHLGNSLLGRDIRGVTTGALAKSKMGGMHSYEERAKLQKEVAKKGSEIERGKKFEAALQGAAGAAPGTPAMAAAHTAIKDAMGVMNGKGRQGALAALIAKGDEAQAKQVIKFMKKSDFDDIKKSDEWSDEDKNKLFGTLRKAAFEEAVAGDQTDAIKNMVGEMGGEDLLKMGNAAGSKLTAENVVKHYNISQLKAMAESGIDQNLKQEINDRVLDMATRPTAPTQTKVTGFISKHDDWIA